ncbi:hypothetical protein XELAEV_18047840mg [Xenopus laevis]|uniref:Uncharacterized protein n=1 Tax=Xenopus laevis TaxID=8355 RepID=A0A974BVZ9_XENLA|nr:hypothetical protein XELAEV_18047840mg [Xenopus laevis]
MGPYTSCAPPPSSCRACFLCCYTPGKDRRESFYVKGNLMGSCGIWRVFGGFLTITITPPLYKGKSIGKFRSHNKP